jgi:uncharacterized protein (DUF433 family)/Ser/Thr protein kinase RdoA (MazF antagonist)
MPGFDRITFDPDILGGEACIRGPRIPVSLVVNLVANGMTVEKILDEYRDLEVEDVQQALRYAAWATDDTVHIPTEAWEASMSARSLGKPIDGTPNLYAWGEGQILKLCDSSAPADWVESIGRIERALYEAGLPVPKVGELVEMDGGLGQVYERIEGGSMAEALLGMARAGPDTTARLARVFAEAQARIHAYGSIPGLPSQRQLLSTVIHRTNALPPDLKEATLKAFDKVPEGERLCHGDFHPYNVLLSSRGPVVIDWNNAHIGNPLEDVARSALILSGLSVAQPSYRAIIDPFYQAYLERYRQLESVDQQQLAAWQPIVAAVRLNDNVPEQEWLLEQIRIGLVPREGSSKL